MVHAKIYLWFRREWNHTFGKNICQKRKKGKEKRMTLFYSSVLACQKQRLNCHSSPFITGFLLFLPFGFWHFCFWNLNSGLFTSSLWNMSLVGISNMLILLADILFKLRRAYAALYCGPIVSQSFFNKIWCLKNCAKLLIYVWKFWTVGDKQRGTSSRGTNSRFVFDVSVIPNLASILFEWPRDPKKGDFRELKSKKFPGGACSRTPLKIALSALV